jgi:AraC-like DNA-binding protein
MMCLSTITYLLKTMQYQSNETFRIDLSEFWLPMQFLMNTGAGCLMLLCYSLFQDQKRFTYWMLAVFALQLFLSTLRPLFVSNRIAEINVAEIGPFIYFLFGILPILMQLLFAVIGVFWVVRGWRADVVESRRIARWFVVGALSVMTIVVTTSELLVMNASEELGAQVNIYKTYIGSLLIFLIAASSLKFETLIERVSSVASNTATTSQDDYLAQDLARFTAIFEEEKAYSQPGLSIADLSKKAGIPQYRLRHLINQKLGYRNFNALVNKYRVKDACDWLDNPDQVHIPILTIALSVGYQSIAPFNQAFRELMDLTPSQYRRRSQQSQIPERS